MRVYISIRRINLYLYIFGAFLLTGEAIWFVSTTYRLLREGRLFDLHRTQNYDGFATSWADEVGTDILFLT